GVTPPDNCAVSLRVTPGAPELGFGVVVSFNGARQVAVAVLLVTVAPVEAPTPVQVIVSVWFAAPWKLYVALPPFAASEVVESVTFPLMLSVHLTLARSSVPLLVTVPEMIKLLQALVTSSLSTTTSTLIGKSMIVGGAVWFGRFWRVPTR